MFEHGVASADPLPDGVLIWTRCARPGSVSWEMARDPSMLDPLAAGQATAEHAHDLTVHVDVGGLEPSTTYWYRFTADGERSRLGRTRTAPAPGANPGRLRIGLVSCSSWPGGFFTAYRHLAARELDLVVHVGDYIYEYERRPGPRSRSEEDLELGAVTLGEYRSRHARYRTDADLADLHARHPVVAVWDDHDVAGGSWSEGAVRHDPARQGDWHQRLAVAMRAWREWVPVRSPDPADVRRVHRKIALGGLADLFMLDTRFACRDRPAGRARPVARVRRRDRRLLGEPQWRWLEDEVEASTARWKLLGNQVVMAEIAALGRLGPFGVNSDQWDGYPAERQRMYDLFARRDDRMVVLSGDLHSSWAAELPAGVEFVTPAVSAPSFARVLVPPVPGAAAVAARWFRLQNRDVRFSELAGHGYVVVDVTADRVQADWWLIRTVGQQDAPERWAAGWQIGHGDTRLTPASAPTSDQVEPSAALLSPATDSSPRVR
ncbi:MAG: alkaline phosphatase D family protein [Acidimicrobiales bacterium]